MQQHAAVKNFLAKAACLAAVIACLVGFNGWVAGIKAADAQVQAQIDAAERASSRGSFAVADGTYEGTAQGYGGPVTVAVTLENGYITSLELVSAKDEDEAWLKMASKLLDTIPAKQSCDVDVVSDATYSSAGIINATRNAIKSAPEVG